MGSDFYAVLGVARNATREQIRDRFLQLAREQHPDRFDGKEKAAAEEAFQAITQAFNVLGNPELRRRHDAELTAASQGRPKSGGPSDVAKVYLARGVKAYRQKSFLEAADNFDRATKAEPSNALAWHHLAQVCSREDRWLPRAAAAVARACELEPMKPEYFKLAGSIFARKGDKERAERYYREALKWGGEDEEIEQALAELSGKKKGLLGSLFGKSGR